jgi:hypothetical protein
MADQAQEADGTLIHGVSQQMWGHWRQHPVTRMFRQYMRDARTDVEQTAMELWVTGVLAEPVNGELRGRVLNLSDLEAITFDEIALFYDERDKLQAMQNKDDDADGQTNA